MGERGLVEYGITVEKSDIGVHVCPLARKVYVYQTASGLKAIKVGQHRKAPAYTQGILTAEGYLVPPQDIENCRMVSLPAAIWEMAAFDEADSTSDKGEKAVRVVSWMLKEGILPLWVHPELVDDYERQIEGSDIVVEATFRIQVKCDWRGGEGDGCTGNLFLQVAESNPNRAY